MPESLSQILTRITNSITSQNDEIDVQPGEFIYDGVIWVTANTAWRLRYLNDFSTKVQSSTGFRSIINNVTYKTNLAVALGVNPDTSLQYTVAETESLISTELDRYARNHGIFRVGPTFSSGTVYLYYNNNNAVTVAIGSKFWTPDNIYFTSTTAWSGNPVWDANVGRYVASVQVVCDTAGTIGNIWKNRINSTDASTGALTSVRNTSPFTNAIARTSDANFLDTIDEAWTGRNLSTEGGMVRYLEGIAGIVDVLIIYTDDPLMTRARSGAVDIWIVSVDTAVQEDTYDFYAADSENSTLFKVQPVTGINSISGIKNYVEGTDFNFLRDETGGKSGSVEASSRIRWITANRPGEGETLTLTYIYDKAIRDLYGTLFEGDNRLLGTDVLLRAGIRRSLTIEWEVILYPAYNSNMNEIFNDITNLVAGYFAGSDEYDISATGFEYTFDQSDIIALVRNNIEEVDDIRLPVTFFYLDDQTPAAYSTFTAERNEFIRLSDITFTGTTYHILAGS